VREQEVEHSPVALFEVGTGAIELQPRLSVAAGTEPQTHHVFDAYRAGRMLIQLEPVKLALGEEIRVLASAVDGSHRILMPVALHCSPHFWSHLAERLTYPDDRRFRIALQPFVVGDRVAGHNAP
jgi:hypothetical protein